MDAPAYSVHEVLLDVRSVSWSVGGKQILRDVNATIRNIVREGHTQGQVVGFLGPSGRGKTTLCNIIAGLLEPTTGAVLVTDKGVPVRAGMVGVVPQAYPLFDHRTVLGNLMVAARQARLPDVQAREKAMGLLDRLGVSDKAGSWPAELSGGQRQRVAIARQLMCSEHYLVMDEPFSGLDLVAKDEVCRLIAQVAAMDELNTIIVVTHDPASAIAVSDTLWCIGFDRNPDGSPIPGAGIKATYDLAARGLAWHEDVSEMPGFMECMREIRARMRTL